MDEDKVLAWLTDFNSMELPDEIEEVNAAILKKVVDENDFVAVLFCKFSCRVITRFILYLAAYCLCALTCMFCLFLL